MLQLEFTQRSLWLVRHGSTDWSEAGRHTGRADVALNERGREEARRTGELLAAQAFSAVLVSSQGRARETCSLLGYGEQAEPLDDLVEWDYGLYEGQTDEQTHAQRPGWSLLRDGAPRGESPAAVIERAARVLQRIAGEETKRGSGDAGALDRGSTPGPTLIVSHGKTLRVLAALWLGSGCELAEHLPYDAAALSVLDRDEGVPVLRLWNRR